MACGLFGGVSCEGVGVANRFWILDLGFWIEERGWPYGVSGPKSGFQN
jgi:hypothetical protein